MKIDYSVYVCVTAIAIMNELV